MSTIKKIQYITAIAAVCLLSVFLILREIEVSVFALNLTLLIITIACAIASVVTGFMVNEKKEDSKITTVCLVISIIIIIYSSIVLLFVSINGEQSEYSKEGSKILKEVTSVSVNVKSCSETKFELFGYKYYVLTIDENEKSIFENKMSKEWKSAKDIANENVNLYFELSQRYNDFTHAYLLPDNLSDSKMDDFQTIVIYYSNKTNNNISILIYE